MKELDIFIAGELVDLCIPTEEFAKESHWYSWFNKKSITRYLDQGAFPNTAEQQLAFFRSNQSQRLMLIISNKKQYVGIISLSSINLEKKICDIAIVVDSSLDKKNVPFLSLEAMALLTEHAFTELGMQRIEAGQHCKLKGWQQRMELIGYKLEGLHARKFITGQERSTAVSIACLYEDYLSIIKQRKAFWDSKNNMIKRFQKLPKHSFADQLERFFSDQRLKYYDEIEKL